MPYNSLIERSDTAALVPEEVSTAMLTSLQAQSAALQLGTFIPLSRNTVRMPVLSALPMAYFVNGDTGQKQTTDAAWANKYLYVEEIATIVPIPDNVLEDAGYDVWAAIQPLMEAAVVRVLDGAIFFGTNAPATWATEGNLVGKAVAAGNVVARGTNDAAEGGLHGDLSDMIALLEEDGQIATGAVANVTTRGRLRKVRDTTGRVLALPEDIPTPMYPASLAGMWPTGASAAEVLAGDWSKLIVGVRKDFTYKLITEGVITDESGRIVYNLPQQDMSALRLVFRAGYAVGNPINFQNETEATRSPFAVLRSPA